MKLNGKGYNGNNDIIYILNNDNEWVNKFNDKGTL